MSGRGTRAVFDEHLPCFEARRPPLSQSDTVPVENANRKKEGNHKPLTALHFADSSHIGRSYHDGRGTETLGQFNGPSFRQFENSTIFREVCNTMPIERSLSSSSVVDLYPTTDLAARIHAG